MNDPAHTPNQVPLASRRDLLTWGLKAGGLLLLHQPGQALAAVAEAAAAASPGYQLLALLPFVDEGELPSGVLSGEGLHGRRAFDHFMMTSKKLITPNEKFFVRTAYPPQLETRTGWSVELGGLVGKPQRLDLRELENRSRPLGVHLMECAGSTRNSRFGLMGAAAWDGVPLAEIVPPMAPRPEAKRVLVSGIDPEVGPHQGASWIFGLEELLGTGAALVTRMNGVPLPKDNGHPLRLIVPGWYGCCWIKWVEGLRLVADDVEATLQMLEYASRTYQRGLPRRAAEFAPSLVDQAAMPIRVEKWRQEGGGLFYRVVGVVWGGTRTTDRLEIRCGVDEPFVPVDGFEHRTNQTWTLWSHRWQPAAPGRYPIELRFPDPTIQTRRLDSGFYRRSVAVQEV